MTMQVVWDIERKEQRRKIALYRKVPTGATVFAKRSPVRSRRVRIWTKEEIERRAGK